MESAVDLSQPGTTRVPYRQTCSISHGEALFLKCDQVDTSDQALAGLFQGLSARVIIKDSNSNETGIAKIDPTTVQEWNGQVMLTGFRPFPNGDYVATIEVESGAPALANKNQLLYAKYQLCGLEKMPAFIASVFAFGIGIVCVVSAICVSPGLLRYGIWHVVSNPERDA